MLNFTAGSLNFDLEGKCKIIKYREIKKIYPNVSGFICKKKKKLKLDWYGQPRPQPCIWFLCLRAMFKQGSKTEQRKYTVELKWRNSHPLFIFEILYTECTREI